MNGVKVVLSPGDPNERNEEKLEGRAVISRVGFPRINL